MMDGFQWPCESLPNDMADLPNYNGLEPSHKLFEESMDLLASMLHSRPRSWRFWLKAGIFTAGILLVCSIALIVSLITSQTNRVTPPPFKPPVTSRDIDAMAAKV